MKLTISEQYAVAIENNGHIDYVNWCQTLGEARKYAKEIRSEVTNPEERKSVLIVKVLRL